jgi:hypothetical protein
MINQLLKLGALLATGRFFKQRWRGVLAVLAVWLALWVVHGEFVRYVELSGNTQYVLHASIAKLVVYALSIAAYVWRVERPLWPKTLAPVAQAAAKPLAAPGKAAAVQAPAPAAGDDGFDFLRHRKPKE